ncbi:glycosyltransferase family 2 protein [Pectobacterium parmentieri]|uniref:Beta-1,3-N-acetylglucosaminyltransferase n=1 Tax=Pectobacterium parmentieri TaxID=1905730 RepID=A0A0H3I4Y0_PECPM|nr:glycosyltransferase family 2 protein [Pectobacterium parmentieri]AFI91094.1 Beta-1,3-N-acetylglucosaminyltransferase [Pectobacterium parmentieri]MCL6355544.1 glycosyltransferase family 2 protein [Pectobacterium parmentieri]MCL6380570.1 glycosyltransferase family 2 protein [Pectobacterium parmentieri]RKO80750.1 glycosyltransferase family 2 protein [Pectobacterium parmentieri]
MLISIIIPAFNAEKTIGKCLDSILRQVDGVNYEIIVIDDGSTDKTKEVIFKYQNGCNIVYLWQSNSKQSIARNHGLEHAKGEYIFFFDADDIVENGMIPKMIHHIKDTESDLVVCGIKKIFIDNHGNKHEVDEVYSGLEKTESPIESFLTSGKEMDAGLWNKIFKRRIISDHNIMFDNGNFFEDNLFVLKYLLSINGNICFIHEPLYLLYKRAGSTTTAYNKDIISYAKDYLNKVKESCNIEGGLSESCENAFLLRLYIHIFHHHVKYSPAWGVREMLSLKSFFNINIKTVFFNSLPTKYKIAAFMVLIFPRGYSFVYKKMMS